jgi:hypothetical protein
VIAAHSGHTSVATLLLSGANPDAAAIGYRRCTPPCPRRSGAGGADCAPGERNVITKGTPMRRNGRDFELRTRLQPHLLGPV